MRPLPFLFPSTQQSRMINPQQYVAGIMRRLREHEYNPELMKLYIVGGGGCLIRNFGEYDPNRVTINDDIRATAKGYEFLANLKLKKASAA